MFGNLEIFQLATGMARHAGARQAKIAANIANADTPGYRAQDIKPFVETYRADPRLDASNGLRATRAGHLDIGGSSPLPRLELAEIDRPSGASPSGNTVSLEQEILQGIEADRAHSRAVTIYETALGILRTSLKPGR